jgi:hypothetical protein
VPETQDIDFIVMPGRFPPPVGKDLINVQGLRTQESQSRLPDLRLDREGCLDCFQNIRLDLQ